MVGLEKEKSSNEAEVHPEIELNEFIYQVTVKIGAKITEMTALKAMIQSRFEATGRSYYQRRLNVYLLLQIMIVVSAQEPVAPTVEIMDTL